MRSLRISRGGSGRNWTSSTGGNHYRSITDEYSDAIEKLEDMDKLSIKELLKRFFQIHKILRAQSLTFGKVTIDKIKNDRYQLEGGKGKDKTNEKQYPWFKIKREIFSRRTE